MIKPHELKSKSVMIATPMYGGVAQGLYMASCLQLQTHLDTFGIQCGFACVFSDALITRARNYLVHQFLKSSATHLLFIDADIGFEPSHVTNMMMLDKDVIGAPYAKKEINWANIKTAVLADPTISEQDLSQLAGNCVFNLSGAHQAVDGMVPIEVDYIGTGFMLIKREAFTKMITVYPELRYRSEYPNDIGTKTYIYNFFDCMVFDDKYLSEDYAFCRRWKSIGGSIFLCPWMKLQHIGPYAYEADIPAMMKYVPLTDIADT